MPRCLKCEAKINYTGAVFRRIYKMGCLSCGVQLTAPFAYRTVVGAVGGGRGSYIGIKLRRDNFSTSTEIFIVLLWFIPYAASTWVFLFLFDKYEILD